MRRPDLRVFGRSEAARTTRLFVLGPVVLGLAIGAIAASIGSDEIEWTVAALVFTGFATLLLAVATYMLVLDARANAAQRPRLTLAWDPEKGESIPAESRIRVRLRVHNAPGLRAAQGTRVLLDRCVEPDGKSIIFGSPALRWMGARAPHEHEPVVVFAGAWRVITLGDLVHVRPAWRLKLGLEKPESFGAGTTYRLIVGSDEADARFYDVTVGWREDPVSVKEVFNSLAIRIDEVLPDELSS